MDPELHRAHSDLDETHWWFRGRRRIIDAVLRRHAPDVEGTVLDVGCGAGGLLSMLAAYGPVVAIEGEPSTAAVAAKRHPHADVRSGELPDAVVDVPPCRIVSAFDVIEHVEDDVGLLRVMASVLGPTGIVCVTVPALEFLWSRHDDANGHLRRYSARSLSETFAAADLDVRHLSYFNTALFPAIAAVRLAERVVGPREGGDFQRRAGRLEGVLERAFAAERVLVSRWKVPVGVSLIAVATPR